MKDPRCVLRQQDLDLDRVRKEIQALLTVIPLLAYDQPFCDVMHEVLLAFSSTPTDPSDNDMAQLEIDHPFVRHLRLSEPSIPRLLSGADLCRSPGGSGSGDRKP
jgi:hypothetical protein